MYVDRDAHPSAAPYYELSIPASNDVYAPGKYFHKPNFIIFNLAIGGTFPGIYNIDEITALVQGPRSMYIDYVRIYQRGDAGESFSSTVASEQMEETLATTDHLQTDAAPATKILRDGQLLIRRGDTLYDIQGNIIQ